MAVTRSRAAERTDVRRLSGRKTGWRRSELIWTVAAGLLIGMGLFLVFQAKAQALAAAEQGLAGKTILNLNELGAREDLLPALRVIPDQRTRLEAARRIYYLSGS